ncbi:hypothetical protein BYT27DRAFT_6517220 [Phlegmacium glaucopus]|nr:hypothetical protein BYT27DRAFT_6517220 [Phlegmacium glaucopus]
MRRSFEKPSRGFAISIPLGHSLGNGEALNNSSGPGPDTLFRPTSQDDVSRSSGDSPKIQSLSSHPPPDDESPLKVRLKISNGVEDLESDSDKIEILHLQLAGPWITRLSTYQSALL